MTWVCCLLGGFGMAIVYFDGVLGIYALSATVLLKLLADDFRQEKLQ